MLRDLIGGPTLTPEHLDSRISLARRSFVIKDPFPAARRPNVPSAQSLFLSETHSLFNSNSQLVLQRLKGLVRRQIETIEAIRILVRSCHFCAPIDSGA